MAYEHRELHGSSFKNDKKENPIQPDYNGSALIGGVEYWVSTWVKDSNGKKYFSHAFKPKQQPPIAQPPQQGTSDDDSLPF
jgi:hypothetical protein